MRILIVGDMHADENKRFDDFKKCLSDIEDFIENELGQIDAYFQTGDLVHKNTPTPLEISTLTNHFIKILNKGIQVFISSGHHEAINKNVSAIDWMKLGAIVKEEIQEENIYMAHSSIKEAKVGAQKISLGNVSYKDIYKRTNADILIIGHIHTPQIIKKEKPLVIVPGSIYKVSFAERFDKKYVWFLDTEAMILKKRELDKRKMLYIIFDLDNKELIVNDKKVNKFSPEYAIIKAEVRGKKQTIDKVKYDKLMEMFEGNYSLDLKFIYTDAEKINNSILDKKISKSDLLKRYCKDNKIENNIHDLCNKIMTKVGK